MAEYQIIDEEHGSVTQVSEHSPKFAEYLDFVADRRKMTAQEVQRIMDYGGTVSTGSLSMRRYTRERELDSIEFQRQVSARIFADLVACTVEATPQENAARAWTCAEALDAERIKRETAAIAKAEGGAA